MNPVSGVMLISLVRHDTLGDSPNSIEAAAMGCTNPVNRENTAELLIREGYKVVTVTADCRICEHFGLCYGSSNYSQFLSLLVKKLMPAMLACALNAYDVHEKKPQQIILGIRGHFLLADTGAPLCLLS